MSYEFVRKCLEYCYNSAGDYTKFLWVLLIFCVCRCIHILWRPFQRFRNLSDFGYEDVQNRAELKSKTDKSTAINYVRARRKIGDLPPSYPNGWFVALESDDLPKAKVKELYVLGQNLVAWRGESGKSYIANAYCPHLGAHLGVGGKVAGECIKCPFHGWTFQGRDGKLVDVPYSNSSVSEFAKIKIWRTVEMNGFIYLWFHAENEEPTWFPAEISEIQNGSWKYRGRVELLIGCHCQEISENAADGSHFNFVHKSSFLTGSEGGWRERLSFVDDVYKSSWAPSKTQGHVATLEIEHHMLLFNKFRLPGSNSKVFQIGPGTVTQEFVTPFGEGILMQFITPIEPLCQRVLIRFYSYPALITPYAKIILLAVANNFERDIRIWNRKTFLNKPILTKEDSPLRSFRKWYSQFYTENSPRNYFSKDEHTTKEKEF